jgi:hypothetical protein
MGCLEVLDRNVCEGPTGQACLGRRWDGVLWPGRGRREPTHVPVCRDLDHARLLALGERLHPLFRLFLIINLGPSVPHAEVVCLAIMMLKRVVCRSACIRSPCYRVCTCRVGEKPRHTIEDTLFEEHLCSFPADLPPGCNGAYGGFPAELRELFKRVFEDIPLLLGAHRRRVFVRVAMETSVLNQRALTDS